MVAVLFVCMGNICRSPMAEGAFRTAAKAASLLDQLEIDSAGTIGYHAGSAPDPRAQAASLKYGTDISSQRSRQVQADDFEHFDYILAMDRDNFEELTNRCPEAYRHKLHMFLGFAPHLPINEMPDPYYGHRHDFDTCYKTAIDAAAGLLHMIKTEHF